MKEIRKIVDLYDSLDWENEKAALATVVEVKESSYRRIGARMFVKDNGDWIGGISGGCLEGDALKKAQRAIYDKDSSLVVYDTMEDDARQIGVGLGCNGRIDVLFKSIDFSDKNNPIEKLRSITTKRTENVLIQLISTSDSKRQLIGDVFWEADIQLLSDTFSIPLETISYCIDEVKIRKESMVHSIYSDSNESFKILFEFLKPEMRIVLAGDNYDVEAFLGIAKELGWEVFVVGLKRKFSKEVYNLSKAQLEFEDLERIDFDNYTSVVLMTHDYERDKQILKVLNGKSIPYLGVLGPRKRSVKLENELQSEGYDIKLLHSENVFSPIGLDIGSQSPEEIAIAVAAEIISKFRNREGRSLKFREGSIYKR